MVVTVFVQCIRKGGLKLYLVFHGCYTEQGNFNLHIYSTENVPIVLSVLV